jgi:hypothetical protein
MTTPTILDMTMRIIDTLTSHLANSDIREELVAASDGRAANLFLLGMLDAVREDRLGKGESGVDLDAEIVELEKGLGLA